MKKFARAEIPRGSFFQKASDLMDLLSIISQAIEAPFADMVKPRYFVLTVVGMGDKDQSEELKGSRNNLFRFVRRPEHL